MKVLAPQSASSNTRETPRITLIAAGVDGHPEGEDAATLGAAIARVTGAELMLVAVHANPMLPLPAELGWKGLRKHAERMLWKVRDTYAPGARVDVETDLSVARGLHRVVLEHHRDLLVVGSSRQAPEGRVRIGKRTRQLLGHFECALAVAPRGLHTRQDLALRSIGVGYDGEPESEAALVLAASIAAAADVELRVCGVVDDRVPVLLRSPVDGLVAKEWQDVIAEEERRLEDQIRAKSNEIAAVVKPEVKRGRPADALLDLCQQVDLMVIGSRRWGPVQRVLLGSTGEALLHGAACPVLAVPRPAA